MTSAIGIIDQLNASGSGEAIEVLASLYSLAHAAFLGVILMMLTAWVSKNSDSIGGEITVSPAERIFSAANVLYLCFGMAGMMLLVNNNIARAFAIAAAIALVRFRIKVNSKILSMSLFYGVLSGMACGVGYVFIGYILVAFFGVLQLVVLTTAKLAEGKHKKEQATLGFHPGELGIQSKDHKFYEGPDHPAP